MLAQAQRFDFCSFIFGGLGDSADPFEVHCIYLFFYDMVIEGSIISKCLDQIARTGKLFASAKIAVGHVFSPPQFKGAQL